jgi:hypothetical protein
MSNISFQARSHETESKIGHCLVLIEVIDVNDSPPVFVNQPYMLAMAQDAKQGEAVITVKAVDADSGVNGKLNYTLKDTSYFTVDDKGTITVTRDLADLGSHVEFVVEASDQGMIHISASMI